MIFPSRRPSTHQGDSGRTGADRQRPLVHGLQRLIRIDPAKAMAVQERVDHRRLLEPIGNIPPAE